MRFSLVLAALALSTVAFAQPQDGPFHIGYAANLNIGDSVLNITNDGFNGGVFGNVGAAGNTVGNICANVYVFDPREEEIGCCACLVTPNGLNSLSAKADLISNNLTPDVPTSIVIKLIGNTPTAIAPAAALTSCNPATVGTTGPAPVSGLLAWGTTLEPSSSPGTYDVVSVSYLNGTLSASELGGVVALCNFIQSNGSNFGICRSCRLGALGGSRQ